MAQTSPTAKLMIEQSMKEGVGRLEFLENEMRKLAMQEAERLSRENSSTGVAHQREHGSKAAADTQPVSRFSYLQSGIALTSELVNFRLGEVLEKLAMEQRLRNGTENLIAALASSGNIDARRKLELEKKTAESKAKNTALLRSKVRYSQIFIQNPDSLTDEPIQGIDF